MHYRIDETETDPSATLIYCLHGFGMNEDWFARLLHPILKSPYRFVFLRAPFAVKTNEDGSVGCSWYDYDGDQEKYLRELIRTEKLLHEVLTQIEAEASGSPSARVLLGFSQGGYCGSFVALRNPDLFSGLIVSGARIKTEVLTDDLPRAAEGGLRVLICHGERDPHVQPEAAERSFEGLRASGVSVHLETFDAGHSLGRGQLRFIESWLERL